MENLKHTSGEWNYDINSNKGFDIFLKDSLKTVATVLTKNVSYMPNETEAQANAKLIASAPELLEALIEAKKVLQYTIDGRLSLDMLAQERAYNQITNAINKATK